MNLLVYVTDDGKGGATGPTLFLPETDVVGFPPHPRSLHWKYFATISDQDELFQEFIGGQEGLDLDGYYMADRCPALASPDMVRVIARWQREGRPGGGPAGR